jgi:S1-C subfamily serine protease
LIASDIPSIPGNSGGPVLNERGELVGVHSGYANDAQISYAISSSEVRTLLGECRENRRPRPMAVMADALPGGRPARVDR